MKRNRFIYGALAFLAALALPVGCVEEQSPEANAVQTKETEVVFAARNAEPQTISVFADGEWLADVTEDWIDLSVMSGDKNTEVTISVTGDNVDAKGALRAPRTGTITFKGRSEERIGVVTVTQKGDNYLGINEYTVTEVYNDLKDEDKFKISEASVMAVSDGGFVITDGTTLMYAEGGSEISAGDKVFMNGSKTTIGGIPAVKADEVEVLSSEEVKYPEPESIGQDMLGKVTYVSLDGTLLGSTLILEEGKGNILDAPESFGLAKLNVHKVTVEGYYVGMIDKQYSMVLTAVEDKGADNTIGQSMPYKDDFSWLAPFIEQANAALDPANKISDCVAGAISSADGAANIYTTLVDKGVKVLDELRLRGYTDLNPDFKTIYLQDAYFKFGAGKKQSGLTLPLMKMDGAQDIVVAFKWCAHIGGSGAVDDTEIVLEIDGPGTVVTKAGTPDAKVSDPVANTQKTGEMFWQDVSFKIEGATTATSISFRPSVFGSPEAQEGGYYRYYVDDIEVMLAADAVPANITVAGVEDNLITFEGTPEAPFEFEVTADADFSVSSSVKWLTVENGEGLAGETNKVKVTCAESDLSTLRKAELTVKAGITVKKIQVVQSSAGAAIDPFISLTSGNSVSVLGEGETVKAKVQSNTEYKVEILAYWISEEQTPATLALVDVHEYSFKVKPNLTGSPRSGEIRFFNEGLNIETVLTVKQENFEPRVTVTSDFSALGVSGLGGVFNYSVDANIPFTVSADASWVTFSVSEGDAGKFVMPITVASNSGEARSAKIIFRNSEYSFEETFEITQFASGVIFADDFSWLSSLVGEYNSANPGNPIGDSVKSQDSGANAPNAYTAEPFASGFPAALAQAGYTDLNPSGKVLYPQDMYLKQGKTSVHTSLKFSPFNEACDAVLEFDWCAHIQGTGKVDPVTLTVVITGDGHFENGTKYSDPLSNTQQQGEMFWTHSYVKIIGATAGTSINIVYTDCLDKASGSYDFKVKGAHRWHLDNVKISR